MKIVFSLLAVLLLLTSITFGTLISARHREKAFVTLHPGDARAEVVQRMGSARQTGPCTDLPRPKPGCATELLFAHPLAPVVPEYWIVRLDSTDRVQQTIQSTVRSSF